MFGNEHLRSGNTWEVEDFVCCRCKWWDCVRAGQLIR